MSLGDYFDERGRELDDLQQRLRDEFPELVELVRSGVERPVRLLCPRGHRLLTVTLAAGPSGELSVGPLRERESGRVVATPSAPRSTGRPAPSPCLEPDCSQAVVVAGYCADHGGATVDDLSGVKATLRCPKCSYRGDAKQVTLLKLYAVAVRLDLAEVRMPS